MSTEPEPKQIVTSEQRSRQLARELIQGGLPRERLLRAVLRVVLQSLTETRQRYNALAEHLNRRDGTAFPLLANRTWEELRQAVVDLIDAD